MRLLVRLTAPARVRPRSRESLVLPLYLMMAGAGGLWSALRGHLNVWRIQQHPDPSPIAGAVIGIAFGLMLVGASRVSVARYGWARSLEQDFRHRLGPLTARECWMLALASSLGEEILFRGALMPAVGVGLSSVIFALMHIGQFPRYLPWTASALVAGLGFGLLYRWSGDLTGPVLAHFLVNYLNLRRLGHRG
jgi:membrane protease YdiL (CAAX protease family)